VEQLVWQVTDSGGGRHRVEIAKPSFLAGPARAFSVDGAPYSLGKLFQRASREVEVELGPETARLTMHGVIPRAGIRFRRALRGSLKPWVLLAYLFGEGGGASGAAATGTMLTWMIYTLSVGGRDRGSWVIRSVGGVAEAIQFAKPGAALPDENSDQWP